jgi:hypothetical protein
MSKQQKKGQPHQFNSWDVPEWMPGADARCSNPAQREAFERRCIDVYKEEENERKREEKQELKEEAKKIQEACDQLCEMVRGNSRRLLKGRTSS